MFQRMIKEKEVKKEVKKEKRKNILPVLLFLVVFVNYFPLIVGNFNTKASVAVDIVPMVAAFGIECLILAMYFFKRIKITKKEVINFIALVIISIISLVVQVISYKNNDYEILDFANIACKFINIILLFILMLNTKIEEKYINNFMRLIVIMGIIACIQNMILYSDEILSALKLVEDIVPLRGAKSFFSQKNPYAFFLYISVISTIFLFQKESKPIWKVVLGLSLILFLFNIVFTLSRTGTAMVILFLALWFLFTDRIKIRYKIILGILGVLIVIGCLYILNEYNPEFLDKLLRLETVKTFTGRTKLWEIAENELKENPINGIIGIGRFKAESKLESWNLTQFHNTYIEFLVSGGIIELVYFVSIYFVVIIKVLKSSVEKKYKSIYFAMFISYAIYMCFESLGRFSIGFSDTMCLVFFVTIPLLHANSCCKEKVEVGNLEKGEEE